MRLKATSSCFLSARRVIYSGISEILLLSIVDNYAVLAAVYCLLYTHANLCEEQGIPIAAGLLGRLIIACSDITLLEYGSVVVRYLS